MIGLLIVSHFGLAREFQIALEHICGEQNQMATLSILPEDTIENRLDDVYTQIEKVDSGEGVLLLTDMFGATPSNIALCALDRKNSVEIIAGFNLPMLIKLACARKKSSLSELVLLAEVSSRHHIYSGKEMVCHYTPKVREPSS